jgi:predicted RNA-binding protein with RPS1 domain
MADFDSERGQLGLRSEGKKTKVKSKSEDDGDGNGHGPQLSQLSTDDPAPFSKPVRQAYGSYRPRKQEYRPGYKKPYVPLPSAHRKKTYKSPDPITDLERIDRQSNRALAKASATKRESKNLKKIYDYKSAMENVRALKDAARVPRFLEVRDPARVKLSSFHVDQKLTGKVISLVPYGVFVDVNSTVDGLVHIKDIDPSGFVSIIGDAFKPGDVVEVYVKYFVEEVDDPEEEGGFERGKLALSMVPMSQRMDRMFDKNSQMLGLENFDPSDEVWGTVVKVTNFGAYIDVGAKTHAFLHFMDHPDWVVHFQKKEFDPKPSDWIERGSKVRVWVKDVQPAGEDKKEGRIKVTGVRPTDLPVLGWDVK